MREILFRGKRKDNGEWVVGSCIYAHKWNWDGSAGHLICDIYGTTKTQVIPETIGQFTGLTDNKTGKKIFEGDIVTGRFLHSLPINSVIAFRNGAFGLLWDRAGAETFDAFTSLCNIEYEVIGNIHDNPELLGE